VSLNDFLSLKTDVNVPTENKKQNKLEKKLIFCWHLGQKSHWWKARIRIHNSSVRIQGSGSVPKCHGSWTLMLWISIKTPCNYYILHFFGSVTFWYGSGSVPLTNGSGSCSRSISCYFHHWPSRSQQRTIFSLSFSALIVFEGTFTSFFTDKKS
jgi:hypothetical protein